MDLQSPAGKASVQAMPKQYIPFFPGLQFLFRERLYAGRMIPDDRPDIALEFAPRAHDLVAAAAAAQAEIRADAQHLPLTAAAGVALFHLQTVAYLNVRCYSPFILSQYAFAACSVLLSPYS